MSMQLSEVSGPCSLVTPENRDWDLVPWETHGCSESGLSSGPATNVRFGPASGGRASHFSGSVISRQPAAGGEWHLMWRTAFDECQSWCHWQWQVNGNYYVVQAFHGRRFKVPHQPVRDQRKNYLPAYTGTGTGTPDGIIRVAHPLSPYLCHLHDSDRSLYQQRFFCICTTYQFCVTNFGDYRSIASQPCCFGGLRAAVRFHGEFVKQPLLKGRSFYAHRIYCLGGGSPYLPVAIVVCDALITTGMVYYLLSNRTQVRRTNNVLNLLAIYSINCGTLHFLNSRRYLRETLDGPEGVVATFTQLRVRTGTTVPWGVQDTTEASTNAAVLESLPPASVSSDTSLSDSVIAFDRERYPMPPAMQLGLGSNENIKE
ncbi:hypothetical protein EDB85DRAFT_1893143 [Lactarius pseudohatsudake]|nr:hypothetical protein EDB85DRAFT_1893143 [Lactarius pseudohatsudake]